MTVDAVQAAAATLHRTLDDLLGEDFSAPEAREALAVLVAKVEELGDAAHYNTLQAQEWELRCQDTVGQVRALSDERDDLQAALAWAFPAEEGFTEAFDGLLERGLLVAVPADEAFKAEWDTDTMYVWSWKAAALSNPTATTDTGDLDLPGMWTRADFEGGDPDERSHAARAVTTDSLKDVADFLHGREAYGAKAIVLRAVAELRALTDERDRLQARLDAWESQRPLDPDPERVQFVQVVQERDRLRAAAGYAVDGLTAAYELLTRPREELAAEGFFDQGAAGLPELVATARGYLTRALSNPTATTGVHHRSADVEVPLAKPPHGPHPADSYTYEGCPGCHPVRYLRDD